MKVELKIPTLFTIVIEIKLNKRFSYEEWLEYQKHIHWVKRAYDLQNDYEWIVSTQSDPSELDYLPF